MLFGRRRVPRSEGRGPGRMGGLLAAGPGGECMCPRCGHRIPHEIGTPCNRVTCPQCGARMTRV